ncbi:MAG: (d)CMP kinase [Gemmatimonadetes bacterium]|nr:(d)CMP kinase [Gemmatimonadota bacterium]
MLAGAPQTGDGSVIVTIDGPAGSGKSSTAAAVAGRLGFRHLDSGAFYRALTWAVLAAGIPTEHWHSLTTAQLDALNVRGEPAGSGYRLFAADQDITGLIRSVEVNANVSPVAALPAVRVWLLDRLRSAALGVDLVTDGRDMGTVVFPGAEQKFYLVADAAVRARRRLLERGEAAHDPERLQSEIGRIEARDRIDSTRAVAPLRRPADAIDLDTTNLTFDQQVGVIVAHVMEWRRVHG